MLCVYFFTRFFALSGFCSFSSVNMILRTSAIALHSLDISGALANFGVEESTWGIKLVKGQAWLDISHLSPLSPLLVGDWRM